MTSDLTSLHASGSDHPKLRRLLSKTALDRLCATNEACEYSAVLEPQC